MTTMTKLAKRVGDFKHLKPGTRVQFMNEGIYEVEAVLVRVTLFYNVLKVHLYGRG